MQFKNEPELIALEQRKHLLRMLYVCSNNKCPTKCVSTSQITQQRADIKNVPLEPPNDKATASAPLHNETIKQSIEESILTSTIVADEDSLKGVLLEDGSRKYGSLILKRR